MSGACAQSIRPALPGQSNRLRMQSLAPRLTGQPDPRRRTIAGMVVERTLKTRDIVLFNVAAIVGMRWVALAAANGPSSLFLWVLAALIFFVPQGFAVIALASAVPEGGGLYVWTSKAFGPRHGFLAGWLYWASNILYFPTLTLSTVVFALYIFGTQFAHLEQSAAYAAGASLVLLAIALFFNIIGFKNGRWVERAGCPRLRPPWWGSWRCSTAVRPRRSQSVRSSHRSASCRPCSFLQTSVLA